MYIHSDEYNFKEDAGGVGNSKKDTAILMARMMASFVK